MGNKAQRNRNARWPLTIAKRALANSQSQTRISPIDVRGLSPLAQAAKLLRHSRARIPSGRRQSRGDRRPAASAQHRTFGAAEFRIAHIPGAAPLGRVQSAQRARKLPSVPFVRSILRTLR